MRKLGIGAVTLDWNNSARRWPDIWVRLNEVPPRIVVTREWARQKPTERRKRLVHELLHVKGLGHGVIGGMAYSTHPERDEYSRHVYNALRRG